MNSVIAQTHLAGTGGRSVPKRESAVSEETASFREALSTTEDGSRHRRDKDVAASRPPFGRLVERLAETMGPLRAGEADAPSDGTPVEPEEGAILAEASPADVDSAPASRSGDSAVIAARRPAATYQPSDPMPAAGPAGQPAAADGQDTASPRTEPEDRLKSSRRAETDGGVRRPFSDVPAPGASGALSLKTSEPAQRTARMQQSEVEHAARPSEPANLSDAIADLPARHDLAPAPCPVANEGSEISRDMSEAVQEGRAAKPQAKPSESAAGHHQGTSPEAASSSEVEPKTSGTTTAVTPSEPRDPRSARWEIAAGRGAAPQQAMPSPNTSEMLQPETATSRRAAPQETSSSPEIHAEIPKMPTQAPRAALAEPDAGAPDAKDGALEAVGRAAAQETVSSPQIHAEMPRPAQAPRVALVERDADAPDAEDETLRTVGRGAGHDAHPTGAAEQPLDDGQPMTGGTDDAGEIARDAVIAVEQDVPSNRVPLPPADEASSDGPDAGDGETAATSPGAPDTTAGDRWPLQQSQAHWSERPETMTPQSSRASRTADRPTDPRSAYATTSLKPQHSAGSPHPRADGHEAAASRSASTDSAGRDAPTADAQPQPAPEPTDAAGQPPASRRVTETVDPGRAPAGAAAPLVRAMASGQARDDRYTAGPVGAARGDAERSGMTAPRSDLASRSASDAAGRQEVMPPSMRQHGAGAPADQPFAAAPAPRIDDNPVTVIAEAYQPTASRAGIGLAAAVDRTFNMPSSVAQPHPAEAPHALSPFVEPLPEPDRENADAARPSPRLPEISPPRETTRRSDQGVPSDQRPADDSSGTAPARMDVAVTRGTEPVPGTIQPSVTAASVLDSLASDPLVKSAISGAVLAAHARDSAARPARSLQIQLRPVELGAVTATLRMSDDRLSVEMTTENIEAYHRLSKESETIVAALRGIGLQVDQITIQPPQPASGASARNEAGMNMQNGAGRDDTFAQAGGSSGGDSGARGGNHSNEGNRNDASLRPSASPARDARAGRGIVI